MEITITTKKSEGVERTLEVSVPAAEVRAAEEKTAQRYASQVRLPGFRPGKAPAAVVKRRFKDVIRQQTLESLVQEAFKEVMEREQLKPASQPHVHDVKFEEDSPLTFELHVEVRPEITLSRREGFRVTRGSTEVTEQMVQEQLDSLREKGATLTPVDGKPAPGDHVTVLLATSEGEGEAIGEGSEYSIELGSGQAIAGVEELVMRLSPGETLEEPVRWPDDFPDESQRGKTKPVRVTLKEVKRKELPALDDAFAREVGDFDSLEALTAAVRKDLAEHATRESDANVRQQLVEQLIEANPFEVPRSWVAQMVDAYMQAYRVPEEERETFAGQFEPLAERQVRRDLIVERIAEAEGLAATEGDVDARVQQVAEQRGADPGQVYASLQKAGRLREIEQSITEEKVFAWLLERNTVE